MEIILHDFLNNDNNVCVSFLSEGQLFWLKILGSHMLSLNILLYFLWHKKFLSERLMMIPFYFSSELHVPFVGGCPNDFFSFS